MTKEQQEFNGLVERLEQHQEALQLSDSQFVARYMNYLGSVKSWQHRLKAKDPDALGRSFPKWLGKVRALVSEIDGGSPVEEFYWDLPIATYATQLYNRLQGQANDRRCGMLLGIYGSGKTAALRQLNRTYPRASAYVRANETWKESKMQIAGGLARVLGSGSHHSAAGTFQRVIEHLKANPITVFIDEAHEGGVLLFKLVKTLIDETRAKFILASYPTAWYRLTNGANDAQAEAQQLMGRTLKPVKTDWCRGLRKEDVEAYLRCSTQLNGRAGDIAGKILPIIRTHGNLRILHDAIERSRILADEMDTHVSPDLLNEQVMELCPETR